jgi:PIN domain nuclease of toxin-antitoxin system
MLLLDTHILWRWLMEEGKLTRAQARALRRVSSERPVAVAGISLWEMAMLYANGRIRLTVPLRDWLERATAPPLVERRDLTPAIAAEVAQLPAWFPGDPADRILVATARVHGDTLVTSDARIVESKLVPTLC